MVACQTERPCFKILRIYRSEVTNEKVDADATEVQPIKDLEKLGISKSVDYDVEIGGDDGEAMERLSVVELVSTEATACNCIFCKDLVLMMLSSFN